MIKGSRYSRRLGVVELSYSQLSNFITGKGIYLPLSLRGFPEDTKIDAIICNPKRENIEIVLSSINMEHKGLYLCGEQQEPPLIDLSFVDVIAGREDLLEDWMNNDNLRPRLLALARKIMTLAK